MSQVPVLNGRPGMSALCHDLSLSWPAVPVSMMLTTSARYGSSTHGTPFGNVALPPQLTLLLLLRSMKRWTAVMLPALESRFAAISDKKAVLYGPALQV